ncbi:PaaI family thioesterase [Pontibacillus marinus]|uniref:Phenylacetic acid degradation protein n=1 Tax=Pontibacillus marinus BH030004 = DSM 16465 TaxID=1385511 RepID=A0A0A5G9J8_9BACI|nr:hotdog fold thioesterase [Pontibacillus marinus]KGX88719.1 phenylacetic acid degradation protein [Pontibacillus marinus BH030004 = DSM 16465]
MNETILETVHADPYAKELGITIEKVDEGFAIASMTINEEHLNFHGAANGGVMFSLADFVFAIASNSHGQIAVGINVNINYMKAGKQGDVLTATAKEVSKNPKLGHYRMTINNQNGELLATADGTVYRKKEYFA